MLVAAILDRARHKGVSSFLASDALCKDYSWVQPCFAFSKASERDMATNANHRRLPPKLGREGTNDLGDGAEVLYIPRFLKKDVADGCFEHLLQDIRWQQRRIVVFGREVAQPRLTAYQADESILSYTYSGITLVPDSWNETVYNIKVRSCPNANAF